MAKCTSQKNSDHLLFVSNEKTFICKNIKIYSFEKVPGKPVIKKNKIEYVF